MYRGVAQFGRALRSGRRGRRFKSCHLDPKDSSPEGGLSFLCTIRKQPSERRAVQLVDKVTYSEICSCQERHERLIMGEGKLLFSFPQAPIFSAFSRNREFRCLRAATRGSASGLRDLFEKRSIKNFNDNPIEVSRQTEQPSERRAVFVFRRNRQHSPSGRASRNPPGYSLSLTVMPQQSASSSAHIAARCHSSCRTV